MANKVYLTQRTIEEIAPTDQRVVYYDTKLPGFLLLVHPTGRKVFQAYRKVGNTPVRVTLGSWPNLSTTAARIKAQDKLALMANGVNPNAKERAHALSEISLQEIFEDYCKARDLKEGTLYDYNRIMDEYLHDWKPRKIKSIKPNEVTAKHAKLSERSAARANNAMRLLRALFNFAKGQYLDENEQPLFPNNPVSQLSHTRQWNRIKRRRTVIKAVDMPAWYEALGKLDEQFTHGSIVSMHYIKALLFTGLRPNEVRQLRWINKPPPKKGQVCSGTYDLRDHTIHLFDPKNREENRIPVSTHAAECFQAMVQYDNDWVFPREDGSDCIEETTFRYWLGKVCKWSGVKATRYDLRRVFLTVAESLNINQVTYKRLVGHKITDQQDVTAGYIILDDDRLRNATQQIGDTIMRFSKNQD